MDLWEAKYAAVSFNDVNERLRVTIVSSICEEVDSTGQIYSDYASIPVSNSNVHLRCSVPVIYGTGIDTDDSFIVTFVQ